jgi:hypothetical protein
MDRALADAEAMRAVGERSGRADLTARALIGLARSVFPRLRQQARQPSWRQAARKSRKKVLVALAQSNLGVMQMRRRQVRMRRAAATPLPGCSTR